METGLPCNTVSAFSVIRCTHFSCIY